MTVFRCFRQLPQVLLALLVFAAGPLAAQGFEVGAIAAQLPQFKPEGLSYKGPGLQAAVDLSGSSRRGFQLRGGFQRHTAGLAQVDLAGLGLQGFYGSEAMETHAMLGLEARYERVSTARVGTTHARVWVRGGLGFRGIIVPLLPFNIFFITNGDDRIVPFTRIEYALPLWKREVRGLEMPSAELSLQIGLRFNLD